MSAGRAVESSKRVGPWMGIVFVVLFVVGFLIFTTPDSNKNTQKWDQWWTDSSHRTAAIIGAYLMVLGCLAFVWFVVDLGQRFASRGLLPIAFGTMFAGLGIVSASIRVAIAGGKQFGDLAVQPGGFSAELDNVGFAILLLSGALAAGAFTGTASYLAYQDGTLPSWLAIAGFVVAVLQLLGTLFFPFALFVIWVLVASIVLLRRSPADGPGGPAGPIA